MADSKPTADELAAMIMDVGKHHHHAYIEADGNDPEWAMWYAGQLQTRLWDSLGVLPSRSELVHFLIQSDLDYQANNIEIPWPKYYAQLMLERFSG